MAAVHERPGPVRSRMLRPYAAARALMAADAASRLPISRARRQQIRTISGLPQTWGRRLDDLGASYREIRWVAAPDPAERPVDVEYRYRALARLLERPPPGAEAAAGPRTFRELVDSFASYDPHTGAEIAPIG